MFFSKNQQNKPWVHYAIAACISIAFYLTLSHLDIIGSILGKVGGFISPVIMAACIAYVLNPLVKLFEKYVFSGIKSQNIRRNFSITGAFIGVLIFFVILIVSLIPQIAGSVVSFAKNFSTYSGTLRELLDRLTRVAADHHINIEGIVSSWDSLLSTFTTWLSENMESIIGTSFSIGSGIAMTIISMILAIYILAAKESIKAGSKRLVRAVMPEKTYTPFADFIGRCNYILIRYIAYDLLDGLIVGIANALFFAATSMPYGVLLSFVCGVTNLAPTFGPIAGGAIGCFILLLVNPWYALWFLIFTIVIQIIDGYIIKPKLFGDMLGVSSVWILVSLIVGGRIFGVAGILLAIPFAAISDYLYKSVLIVKLEQRKREEAGEEEEAAPVEEANPVEEAGGAAEK